MQNCWKAWQSDFKSQICGGSGNLLGTIHFPATAVCQLILPVLPSKPLLTGSVPLGSYKFFWGERVLQDGDVKTSWSGQAYLHVSVYIWVTLLTVMPSKFLHVYHVTRMSFLCKAEQYSTCYSLFMYLSVELWVVSVFCLFVCLFRTEFLYIAFVVLELPL